MWINTLVDKGTKRIEEKAVFMPIKTGEYLNTKDVYIDYGYEEVMFRRERLTGSIFRKFYGGCESEKSIAHDNHLFNHALLYGDEISQEEYMAGKKRR